VTGCLPACTTLKYTLQDKSTSTVNNFKRLSREDMVLKIYLPNPSKVIKKEYKVYEMHNLLADLGGLLGMLLGASVLSFFDCVTDVGKSLYKKSQIV